MHCNTEFYNYNTKIFAFYSMQSLTSGETKQKYRNFVTQNKYFNSQLSPVQPNQERDLLWSTEPPTLCVITVIY